MKEIILQKVKIICPQMIKVDSITHLNNNSSICWLDIHKRYSVDQNTKDYPSNWTPFLENIVEHCNTIHTYKFNIIFYNCTYLENIEEIWDFMNLFNQFWRFNSLLNSNRKLYWIFNTIKLRLNNTVIDVIFLIVLCNSVWI